MTSWISVAITSTVYIITFAIGWGKLNEKLSRNEGDIKESKSKFVYRRNCEADMKNIKEKVDSLEKSRSITDKDIVEIKMKLARIETILENHSSSFKEIKILIQNGRK